MIFGEDIRLSLEALKAGGTILYPTDTIWGLGCDATSQPAVDRIFTIKSRSETKSLLILVDGEAMLERYVSDVPGIAWELLGVSDSPLTLVLPGGRNLAAGVCASDGSVGVRICREPFCNELIRKFRRPLVSTSANFSGKPSPANFASVDESLARLADYVVKYRQDEREEFSSSPVIRIASDGTIEIIRK